MVDGIRNTGAVNVPAQTPVDGAKKASAAAPVTTAKGIADGQDLMVETSDQHAVATGAGSHECEPPAPGADPGLKTPMQNLDDPSWNKTCDIFALIHRALADNNKVQNDLAREQDANSVKELMDYMKSQDKLAADTVEASKAQGIAQAVGGGLAIAGGVGGGFASASPALSASFNSAGGASSGMATGIESAVDAPLQGEMKDDQKEATVAEAAQHKSESLRDKHSGTFSKGMNAEEAISQQRSAMFSAQEQALRAGN